MQICDKKAFKIREKRPISDQNISFGTFKSSISHGYL